LSRQFEFDGETLVAAIRATFARRKTKLLESTPPAFMNDFSKLKSLQWSAFLRKCRLSQMEMSEALDAIRCFADAPLAYASRAESFPKHWSPEAGWQ
jgi:hypothetical protein